MLTKQNFAHARCFLPALGDILPEGTLAFLNGRPDLVTTEHAYGAGEELFGEGEPADYAYQVVRGAVRSYKLLSDGRRQIGAFYLPGDIFGLDLVGGHSSTAEALILTKVRTVRRRSLEAAAAADPDVACELWRMTAGNLRHAEEHMLRLGRKTALERVAAFLLEMDQRLSNAGMSSLPMGRHDIGDYLGLTLETVSRSLARLQKEGIVGFCNARQIVLRNRSRLSALDA